MDNNNSIILFYSIILLFKLTINQSKMKMLCNSTHKRIKISKRKAKLTLSEHEIKYHFSCLRTQRYVVTFLVIGQFTAERGKDVRQVLGEPRRLPLENDYPRLPTLKQQ